VTLEQRKRRPPTWVFHWFDYKNNRRVHHTAKLGDLLSVPTPEQAEELAEDIRHKLAVGPQILRTRRNGSPQPVVCSDDDYAKMVIEQAGRCAICGDLPSRLVLDHCHKTGRKRALLCGRCNSGIGMLDDDPAILRAAANYVERFI
jgi:hypothetical protein